MTAETLPLPAKTGCRRLLLLASFFLLASCAQLQTGIDSEADPEANNQALQNIDTWSVRGRLNIRTAEESRTPDLYWDQQPDSFSLRLSGLLNAVTLRSTPEGVVLEQSGEEPVYARSISDLSVYLLGAEYPADHLLYWVRGLPVPDIPHKLSLNEQQLPETLEQAGWILTYDRYTQTGNVVLPERINISSETDENVRLRFINLDWTLPQ